MRLVWPLGLVAALAASRSAYAAPSARLVYARDTSASSCPDESALRKAVAVRFGYDPFFAWAKKTVVVLVSRDRGAYSARVEIIDAEGIARGARQISSDDESCSELFDAAALAISIALDASMADAPPAPPTPPARPAPSPPPPRAEPPPPPIVTPAPPSTPEDRRPALRGSVPLALGLEGLGVSSGLSPRPALGAAVFAELSPFDALSLGLELQGDRSLDASASPGVAVKTSLFAVNLVPCFRWGALRACGLAELGWLQASATGLQASGSEGTFVSAGGARLGVEWPVGAALFVRAHADGVVVMNQATLDVDYRPFWQTNHLAGALALGAGFRFP
jgi:hypothetical protein